MKTRKFFFGMLAMSGMLLATSCTNDALVNEPVNGDEVDATFVISDATRGDIGKGLNADVVVCGVFDENGVEMGNLRQTVQVQNKVAVFNTRLAKGQAYRIAFFAYDQDVAYDVTDLKDIQIIAGGELSNIEERDAFAAYVNVTAEETVNTVTKPVPLRRIFAQLNLGIDAAEKAAAANAGVEVAKTYIKVTNVYDRFSAYDDAISANATLAPVEFAMNRIPGEELEVEGNTYTYLALNYLLVGNNREEKGLADVEFVWKNADESKTNNPSTHFINIPVQRNWRTNITGNLLTNPAKFTLTIDDEFVNPDGYVENIETAVTETVSTIAELQTAVNAAPVGRTLIKLAGNIDGALTVTQRPDVEILIDGQGNTFTGTIFAAGGSSWGNTEGLTLQNIKFNNDADNIITLGERDDTSTRYVHNVIITDCEFTSQSGRNTPLTAYQANDIKVVNTKATGFHSFAQITGGNNVSFIGVNSECVRGISLGSATNSLVSNSTIKATGAGKYGIRHNADSRNDVLRIVSSNVEAFIPVVVRKTNDTVIESYTLSFEGTNTLAGEEYEVVVGVEEYDALGETVTSLGNNASVNGVNSNWRTQGF